MFEVVSENYQILCFTKIRKLQESYSSHYSTSLVKIAAMEVQIADNMETNTGVTQMCHLERSCGQISFKNLPRAAL
jgi:hypothetical protein